MWHCSQDEALIFSGSEMEPWSPPGGMNGDQHTAMGGGWALFRQAHGPAALLSEDILPLTDSGGWGRAAPSRGMPTFGWGVPGPALLDHTDLPTQQPSLVAPPSPSPPPSSCGLSPALPDSPRAPHTSLGVCLTPVGTLRNGPRHKGSAFLGPGLRSAPNPATCHSGLPTS